MKTFRNDIIISVANDPKTAYFDPRYIRFGGVLYSPLIKIRDFCSWQASTSRPVHAYSIFNLFRQGKINSYYNLLYIQVKDSILLLRLKFHSIFEYFFKT